MASIATNFLHIQKQNARLSVAQNSHPAERKAQTHLQAGRYSTSLQHNDNCNTNTGVTQVKEKILSIDVVDVAVVGVGPAYWPRINDGKPVSTILKTWLAFDDCRMVDDQRMLTPEMGAKFVVGDVAASPVGGVFCLLAIGWCLRLILL